MSNWNYNNLENWINNLSKNKESTDLPNVKKLEISSQYIYDLPDELYNLESLETLIIKDNYISNIERIILEKLVENESSIRNLSKRVKVSDVTLGRKLRKYNIQLD